MDNNFSSNGDGYFKFHNMSGFVAYASITYYIDGKKFYQEYPTFSLFFYETVPVPANATNITIALWNQVRILDWVIFWQDTFPSPVTKCYTVSGVLLVNPTVTEYPCDSVLEGVPNNPNYLHPKCSCHHNHKPHPKKCCNPCKCRPKCHKQCCCKPKCYK
ncbi:MAG: hypothetical protein RR840_01020 [Clostridium sp.]